MGTLQGAAMAPQVVSGVSLSVACCVCCTGTDDCCSCWSTWVSTLMPDKSSKPVLLPDAGNGCDIDAPVCRIHKLVVTGLQSKSLVCSQIAGLQLTTVAHS